MNAQPGFDLEMVQRRHNAIQIAKATGLFPLALVLWFIAYWIFKGFIVIPFYLFGVPLSKAASTAVAWVCMGLLAFEGARYGKEVFDATAAARSFYFHGLTGSDAEFAVAGEPLRWAWFISQVLFSAPRSTVRAVRAVRSLTFLTREELRAGEEIVASVAPKHAWVPVAHWKGREAVLAKLDKLGVIWRRLEKGVREFKVSPTIIRTFNIARREG